MEGESSATIGSRRNDNLAPSPLGLQDIATPIARCFLPPAAGCVSYASRMVV
jgi:hypothetical protein